VAVQGLVTNKLVNVNAQLPRLDGPPALVLAASRSCSADLIKILLQANANVDAVDRCGRTACHDAVWKSDVNCNVVALLLAHQPNLSLCDITGRTSLQLAFEVFSSEQALLMLIKAGAPLENLHPDFLPRFALTSVAAIEALLARGVILRDLCCSFNQTLLHRAARIENIDMLHFLVNVSKLDLEARDLNGDTCTHIATEYENNIALCFFVQNGANVNCLNKSRSTPLHLVNNYECAICLLAAGADPNAITTYGSKPLHLFIDCLSPAGKRIICALMAGGTNIDMTDEFGLALRYLLNKHGLHIDSRRVEKARCDITKARLDFVRYRALQVCIGLHSLDLPALQTCDILLFSCGPIAPLILFHQWWTIATTAKHFRR
jgi:ankyrin repeat protein